MAGFDDMTTRELIETLRGYSAGLKLAGQIAGSDLVRVATDRLEELEEKLHGVSD